MDSKFTSGRTRIVIFTLICAMICAVALVGSFDYGRAKKARVAVSPAIDSREPDVRRGIDKNALSRDGVGAPEQLRQQGASQSPAEASRRLVDEKRSGAHGGALNPRPNTPPEGTKGSAGLSDLMASERATSIVGGNLPESELEERESEKARGDHPGEAVKFRNLQMQDDHGAIPLDGLFKARQQMDVMRAAQQKKAKAAGKPDGMELAGINPASWEWLGPGNIGGRVRTIVIDPTNTNKLFIGSVSGGIWSSTNAGASWSPINDFSANLAVSTMVMNPTNSNIMYAGTGEAFSANLGPTEGEGNLSNKLRGDGVFKSTDGGTTWTQLPRTITSDPTVCAAAGPVCPWSYVNRLAISPDGSTILAGTEFGIMRSLDGGANWTPTPAGLMRYPDIDFDPVNSQLAIAAGYLGASVYSTNGGLNWQNATYSPPLTPALLGGSTGRVEMAYAPSNPSIVYAMIDATQGAGQPPPAGTLIKGNLYKSVNGGAAFTLVNASTPGNTFLGGQGNYGNIIWVNPLDPNFLIVGGINLYRSTDGGINWTAIATGQNGSAHSDHHMVMASPAFNNTTNKQVYFSNDGGIYRADDVSTVSIADGGWTTLNNSLGITQFYAAAANSAGVIVGGTQDNGTLRYSGDLQGWTSMFGGDGGYCAADPSDTNYFYGEYINLGIVRSTDAGGSSGYIYCNPAPTSPNGGPCTGTGIMDAFNGANFIAPFLLDPNEPNRMLAGGLSLWRSNDIKAAGLPTWTAIKPAASPRPPAPGAPPNPIPAISAVVISSNNPDLIVIGHNDGQIYITFDGTGTNPPTSPAWSRIDNGIPAARFVTRLVIDNTRSPNWIYATLGGFAADNVYRTTDLGSTWTDVTGSGDTGLPNVPVRCLTINPVRPDLIYVGTEVGIFASEDAGVTWGLPQGGPAKVPVDDLFWLNGDLVAVTFGRGLFKTNIPVYALTVCSPPTDPVCECFGDWDCPCSWNIRRVPTLDDDIAVVCPMILKPGLSNGGKARNLVVSNILTLDNSLTVTGDMANYGNIRHNPGMQSSISSRNFTNSKPPNVLTLGGVINLLGGISASGNLTNSGVIALSQNLNCVDLSTSPGSTLTANVLNVRGNLSNYGYAEAFNTINVAGDLDNGGSLKGLFLAVTAPATRVKKFSGAGLWQFGAFSIPIGFTVKLGSDVTFDIPSFSNNGTLDFVDRTLNFKGSSFQGAGVAAGTGTLRFVPTSGSSIFNADGPAVTIASGTVEYQSGGTISGPFRVEAGATFAMNTGGLLTVKDNVVVDGALVKTGSNPQFVFNGQTFFNNGSVGDIDFLTFNDGGGPPVQFIAGLGSWAPRNVQIGVSPSTVTVHLSTNITLATNQLVTSAGSTLDVGNFTLSLTGPMNFFSGKISGTGLVKMQPVSGTPRLGTPFASLTIDPDLEVVSGTVKATGTTVGGKLTIQAAATLSLFGFVGISANGDATNNGTLNAFSDNPFFNFKGGTFTNNGTVTGNVYVNFGSSFGPPLVQSLAGTGSWTGSPRLLVDSLSTTTLLNDVTYNGGNLFIEGRLDTDAFTLSLPCNVIWSGAGDLIGNIRRTNLAACPGAAIAFGNPFTTIQFTSGTPPTDVTMSIVKSTPPGFPNAVARTYTITPAGGSGYSATLQLHYLDSELNGNDEATLQLWRNNGTAWNGQGATVRDAANNWVKLSGVTEFSPWAIAGPGGPTAIDLVSFTATRFDNGVALEWRTGLEVDNLGFNIHRDDSGKLTLVNQQLLAGSALTVGNLTLGSGMGYSLWDGGDAQTRGGADAANVRYWIESIDLNGRSQWHGPVVPVPSFRKESQAQDEQTQGQALRLAALGNSQHESEQVEPKARLPRVSSSITLPPVTSSAALKISVKETGWYRITRAELVAAGLDPATDPRRIQLYADGKQQAILINGEQDGRLDPTDSIEFYGLAVDSPYSAARTYWLVPGKDQGQRISTVQSSAKPLPSPGFDFTTERRDRTIYFAALRNGDKENFFGPVVTLQPVDQSVMVKHLAASGLPASLNVALQGVTNSPHVVAVRLNGSNVGQVSLQGQSQGQATMAIPYSLLREGENQVSLNSIAGPSDISLVDYIQLTYQHSFTADDDRVNVAATAGQQLTIDGFDQSEIEVFDLTDPSAVLRVDGYIDGSAKDPSGFRVSFVVPGNGQRSLLALANDHPKHVASLVLDSPSDLHNSGQGADLLIISRREFFGSIEPLKLARQKQGLSVSVIDIEDIYDEFSFGQKTPQAVKAFLSFAGKTWKKPARYVLFFGDASYDPKDYLGLGAGDLVSTRLIDTSFMESASDDWFVDFNDDGLPDLAVGRLPVRTQAESDIVVNKLLAYDKSLGSQEVLLVADVNDGFNFELTIAQLSSLLPPNLRVTQVKRGQVGDIAARTTIIDALNRGQKLVTYSGHASVDVWRANLLTSADASQLSNGDLMPAFVMMNCLNGYFVDPRVESLAEALVRAQKGGAIAVWASSGMSLPEGQIEMTRELYRQVFADGQLRIGDAIIRAKAATADPDVQRTWVLVGDPTMRLR